MSRRRILSRLALASLAAVTIAAPSASAMPADPEGTAAQQDMHASTVEQAVATQDARGESAAGGGTSGGPVREPRVGPPTWPTNPTPLPRPAPQAVATDGGDDIGVDLPVALLILAGTLALGGVMAVAAMKVRVRTGTAQ